MLINRETLSFLISTQRFTNEILLMEYISVLRSSAETLDFDSEFILISHSAHLNISTENQFILSQYRTQVVAVGPRNSWDSDIFMGLTRANGDYCFIAGTPIQNLASLLNLMIIEINKGQSDVIGCTQERRILGLVKSFRKQLVFRHIRRKMRIPLYVEFCEDLLVTRRALNWIIRDQAVSLSLVEILFIPGITVKILSGIDFSKKLQISKKTLSALMIQYTSIPKLLFNFSLYLNLSIMLGVFLNALSVKFFELNLLRQQVSQVPGWTTLVIISAAGFSLVTYSLSIIFRAVMFLSDESKTKPRTSIMSAIRL